MRSEPALLMAEASSSLTQASSPAVRVVVMASSAITVTASDARSGREFLRYPDITPAILPPACPDGHFATVRVSTSK